MLAYLVGDLPLASLLVAASFGGSVVLAVGLLIAAVVFRNSFRSAAKQLITKRKAKSDKDAFDSIQSVDYSGEAQKHALISSLVRAGEPSEHAARFNVDANGTIYATAKPSHSLHANTRCQVSLVDGTLRVTLHHGKKGSPPGSSFSSNRSTTSATSTRSSPSTRSPSTRLPASLMPRSESPSTRSQAASRSPSPSTASTNRRGSSPQPPRESNKLVCIALEAIHSYIDPKDRTILHIVPHGGGSTPSSPRTLCDVEYQVGSRVHTISWTHLRFRFDRNAREADRWYSLLSASPCTDRWLNFVHKIPKNGLTTFNVLLARVLIENSSGPILDDLLTKKLRRELTSVELPSPLKGTTKLVCVSSGDEAPIFTNPNLVGVSPTGEVEIDFDLLYNGGFQLAVDVDMAIGFVKVPDMRLNFTIGRIQGRVHMSIGGPPSHKMWVGFHEPPELNLELHQDVRLPSDILASAVSRVDISKTVTELVREKLLQDMILPAMDDFSLPDLTPTPPGSPRHTSEHAQQTSSEFPPSCCCDP